MTEPGSKTHLLFREEAREWWETFTQAAVLLNRLAGLMPSPEEEQLAAAVSEKLIAIARSLVPRE